VVSGSKRSGDALLVLSLPKDSEGSRAFLNAPPVLNDTIGLREQLATAPHRPRSNQCSPCTEEISHRERCLPLSSKLFRHAVQASGSEESGEVRGKPLFPFFSQPVR
jgi:hypothetical protein